MKFQTKKVHYEAVNPLPNNRMSSQHKQKEKLDTSHENNPCSLFFFKYLFFIIFNFNFLPKVNFFFQYMSKKQMIFDTILRKILSFCFYQNFEYECPLTPTNSEISAASSISTITMDDDSSFFF